MGTLTEFSQGLSAAVEKAGASTILVDARKRYPASGIAYAEDLVLTADHVVTREEDIKVTLPDGRSLAATIAGRDPGSDLALLHLAEKALASAHVPRRNARRIYPQRNHPVSRFFRRSAD